MSQRTSKYQNVKRARLGLVDQGLLEGYVPQGLVDIEIEQSWRRSIASGVDFGAVPAPSDAQSSLRSIAAPVLENLSHALAGTHSSLLLADTNGAIISRVVSARHEEKTLDNVGATVGFDFSEIRLGTNGLGTPIETGREVFVRGPEHFAEALEHLACAGVAIRHPLTKKILGSISIATEDKRADKMMLVVVRQAAVQIATRVESLATARDLDLARAYRRVKSRSNEVLVMNADTVLSDLPLLSNICMDSHALVWDEFRRSNAREIELELSGHEVVARNVAASDGEPIFAIELLSSTASSKASEDFTPTSESKSAKQSQNGRLKAVTVKDIENAAQHGLIRLVGPAGLRKQELATDWIIQKTGRRPRTVGAFELCTKPEAWIEFEQAAQHEEGVLIVGASELTDDCIDKLHDVVNRLQIVVVATERRSPSREPQSELGVVVVHPLRSRPHDIPAAISQVFSELVSEGAVSQNRSAPTFAPAAMERMVGWSWPGNLVELREVLLELSTRVTSGRMIQLEDLPSRIARVAPHLSRVEAAERDAIVTALAEARGNKSLAADILGLGRTTLYRKIRSLRIVDADWKDSEL